MECTNAISGGIKRVLLEKITRVASLIPPEETAAHEGLRRLYDEIADDGYIIGVAASFSEGDEMNKGQALMALSDIIQLVQKIQSDLVAHRTPNWKDLEKVIDSLSMVKAAIQRCRHLVVVERGASCTSNPQS